MPCPPDRRELKSSELDDKVCDLRALHHQCTEMIGSLHLLAHRGGPPIPTALQGLIPPLGALSDAADGCEPLGLREAEKRIRSTKRQLASLEVVCCRLGTALAKAAHPEDLAVLPASERDRVTGCLAYHREHREEDRGVVVRRAIHEGHYRRAVMATSISVERLMTVRSCLNRSSLDRAIARLAGEASARFVLEVARLEGLHEARRQAGGQARARVAAETPEWLDKEQARAHACPMCGCMGTIRTHRTDLESRPGWVEDLYGPGHDLEVAAACAVCDWHDVQQGGQEREPSWSPMSIHKRLSRFVERYPAGPQTARQRRSMMKLLADLQSNRASYRTVRKRVGIRGPQPPVNPEEARFEEYFARFRVTETRRCPACGKKALQRQPDVIRTGNPLSPASDVDLDSHVLCLACGHMLTE